MRAPARGARHREYIAAGELGAPEQLAQRNAQAGHQRQHDQRVGDANGNALGGGPVETSCCCGRARTGCVLSHRSCDSRPSREHQPSKMALACGRKCPDYGSGDCHRRERPCGAADDSGRTSLPERLRARSPPSRPSVAGIRVTVPEPSPDLRASRMPPSSSAAPDGPR